MTNSSVAKPTVTGLVAGQYTFELTVTDNKGASTKAQVKITVNAAPNQSPVANAGSAATITLPTNSATLDGSASSDPDGSIVSYKWVKLSSGVATIANSSVAKTTVSGLVAGQYTFDLTVTDNKGASTKAQVKITVNAAANQSPVANAGSAATITLPTNSATLDGSASSDPDGSIVSYKWVKLSSGVATIANSSVAKTTVSGLVAGQYTFQLTVTDSKGASSTAQVKITVNAAANQSPVANAGTAATITLPTNTVTLDGSASYDRDGSITSYSWVKIIGGAATIANSAVAKPTVSGLVAGQYTFELTVTDNKSASTKAQVRVTVNTATNKLPVANAGPAATITLPTNIATLDGSASYDPDGSITSYSWAKISGGATTIANSRVAKTSISGLAAGQYTFELTVTDNKGASTKAQVKITVNAAANQSPAANAASNQSPAANAGTAATLTLPSNTVSLDRSASSDPDGNITSYNWIKLSGGAATIANSAVVKPTVSGLVAGQYTFELTVTDNKSASTKAQVKITVNAAANQSPAANAGTAATIMLPTNTVTLDGSASSDPDGSIASYSWIKLSGGIATIADSTVAKTTVSGLVAGQYTFELTVIDNKGTSSKAEVKITVNKNYKPTYTLSPDLLADTSSATAPGQTGANERKSFAQLNLYPNPATDIINTEIINDSIGVVTLNIYDLNGRLAEKMELNKQAVSNYVSQQVQQRDIPGLIQDGFILRYLLIFLHYGEVFTLWKQLSTKRQG